MSILKKAITLGVVALSICAFSSNNIPNSKINMLSSIEHATTNTLSIVLDNNILYGSRDK